MTRTEATGYDGLASRLVPEAELREFLLDCFGIAEHELFVSHADRVDEALEGVPKDVTFPAFCTYEEAGGHFAMRFDVGIEGRLAGRVGRREFIARFAARFGMYVLYGDDDPVWLWSVILPDGSHLLAELDDEDGSPMLSAVTAPVPGLTDVRVDESLWRIR